MAGIGRFSHVSPFLTSNAICGLKNNDRTTILVSNDRESCEDVFSIIKSLISSSILCLCVLIYSSIFLKMQENHKISTSK